MPEEAEILDTDFETEEAPEEVEDEVIVDEPEVEADEEVEAKAETESHPFDRPTIAQIKKEYPEIFKKFPQLQDVYFREKEYTKLFPTVDEAKEAAENNSAFVNIQQDIMNGTGEELFSAIRTADPKALDKFSGTLLGTLAKVDLNAFRKAANPLVEDICRQMFTKGQRESNENLQNAARFVSEYFFGSEEFASGEKTSIAPVEAKSNEVANERTAYEQERYSDSLSKVGTSTKTALVALIDNDKFDPQGALTPFVKKTILDQIVNEIGSKLEADPDHMRYMETLWANAKRTGYKDLARIESAFLARAKSLVTPLRAKLVSEALGKKAPIAAGIKTKVQNILQRKDTSGAPSRSGKSGGKIDYSKTSDDDILNDRITYRN